MTKSTITRERLEQLADNNTICKVSWDERIELAQIALAAMDSEPVAEITEDLGRLFVKIHYPTTLRAGDKLYRHAQPAPVVPDDVLDALQKVARLRLDLNDFDGDRRGIADCLCDAEEALIEVVNRRAAMLHAGNSPAQSDRCPAQNCIHSAQGVDRPIAWHHTAKSKEENHSTCCFSYAPSHDFGPWYEKPQSQPHYLPEELDYDRALHFLSTEPRKATPETVIGGNSPAIPGCDGAELLPSTGVVIELNPANNKLYTPLSTGISITREMIIAGQEELEACIDNGFDSDADGNRHDYTAIASDAPYRVFCAMLAAAPQSPGSEPATMPGKWIPVSEQKPDCWCLTCRPVVLSDMRFVVCPDCGNKRCPRANDHRNACTGSNELGQEGSAYPAAPQEVPDEK